MALLEHRRLLEYDSFDTFEGSELIEHLGGEPTVRRLVDAFYDRVRQDGELCWLFADFEKERIRLRAFLAEFLGGGLGYSLTTETGLQARHRNVHITREYAGRWLGHFRRALDEQVHDEQARKSIFESVSALALSLTNESRPPPATKKLRVKDTRCASQHPVNQAVHAASKGDKVKLRQLVKQRSTLLTHVPDAAEIMQAAVSAGKLPVVDYLLENGVSPDKPAPLARYDPVYCTPLCTARLKKRRPVEQRLLGAGAREDIFTAALLGDLVYLEQQLELEPQLANVSDPAADTAKISVLLHAVRGGHADAVRCLLAHGATLVGSGERELDTAVRLAHRELAFLLLEQGARANLGPGRWVLDAELALALGRAGASASDESKRWIWVSCTGNNRQSDDPKYVRALIEHGADVTDRHRGATALHYAAKAGFTETVALLLELGADRGALDDAGLTPVAWLDRAGRSVDRVGVRKLLTS